jgi:hypothetical protein
MDSVAAEGKTGYVASMHDKSVVGENDAASSLAWLQHTSIRSSLYFLQSEAAARKRFTSFIRTRLGARARVSERSKAATRRRRGEESCNGLDWAAHPSWSALL